jgi:hypothetical protein
MPSPKRRTAPPSKRRRAVKRASASKRRSAHPLKPWSAAHPTARCMRCKTEREMRPPVRVRTFSNRGRTSYMAQGACSHCGTKVSRLLSEADARGLPRA